MASTETLLVSLRSHECTIKIPILKTIPYTTIVKKGKQK